MKNITVSIIGVGLIGGSFGKAIKNSKLKIKKVIGVGRHIEKLKIAKKIGAIDEYTTDFIEGIKNADIVMVATPVNTIVPIIKKILPYIKPDCLITDVGSVKKQIVKEIKYQNFVGAHPLAGSEKIGVQYSSPEIFKNATVAITPLENTSKSAIKKVSELWKSIGAKILVISPEEHDYIVAITSHLPHILSSAFVNIVWQENTRNKNISKLLAGSFRDFTRISDSDPYNWSEICYYNQNKIEKQLKKYIKILKNLKIKNLLSFFSQAKNKRWQLLQSNQKKESITH